jgi:protein-disulfide isomerase
MTDHWKSAAWGGLGGAAFAFIVLFGAIRLGFIPGNDAAMHNYLMAHPGILMDMQGELQVQQDEATRTAEQASVDKLGLKAFFDPRVAFVTGPANAKTSVVEFFDYNCPYCRMMPPVMAEAEAADPKLRIVYKELPILGPNSVFAAKAALAADKQGKYVAFHRALFQIRGPLEEGKVLEAAAAIGLDVDRMKADMKDAAVDGALEKTGKLAQALQITGTPGFVVGDQLTTGATDLSTLQALIAKARSGQQDAN